MVEPKLRGDVHIQKDPRGWCLLTVVLGLAALGGLGYLVFWLVTR